MSRWPTHALLAALFLVRTVHAHGGHEQVPDGEAVSLDPIVRYTGPYAERTCSERMQLLMISWPFIAGFDIMAPYATHGICLWGDLPVRHGSGCMYNPELDEHLRTRAVSSPVGCNFFTDINGYCGRLYALDGMCLSKSLERVSPSLPTSSATLTRADSSPRTSMRHLPTR